MTKIGITKQLYNLSVASDWDSFCNLLHPTLGLNQSAGLEYAGTYAGINWDQHLVSTN